MKVVFEKGMLGGFLLAIIIALGIYSYSNNQKSIETSRMIAHTNEVLFHIEQINSSALMIEYEILRFNIFGDTSFLEFYKNELNAASKHVDKFTALTKDNPAQQKNIEILRTIARKKVQLTQKIIEAKLKSPNEISSLVPSTYNRGLTNKFRATISDIKAEENTLLEMRKESNSSEIKKFNITFITLQVFIGLIMIGVTMNVNHNLRRRVKAEESLNSALNDVQDLYDNAPCGYHSLDSEEYFISINSTMLRWIGYTKEDVIGKMTMLDIITQEGVQSFQRELQTLKEQGFINNVEFNILRKDGSTFPIIINSTAEFDSDGKYLGSRFTTLDNTERKLAENKVRLINKELEAFTYSVSHDLRAPLRSIDGYAKILREDYAAKIDDEGNRLLEIIVRNAKRMRQLIDDLLDFSRVSRKELVKSNVDVNLIVEHVKHELLEKEKRSDIVFTIHLLEHAVADPSMLRQVWVNLISNAIKYSSDRHPSRIEIGCYQQNNHVVYFIRDNGVGFDMKYSNKLFGVFQRLHKIEEFEGTGVGLALAHSIVKRHGGEIWADAKIDEGAVFSFFI